MKAKIAISITIICIIVIAVIVYIGKQNDVITLEEPKELMGVERVEALNNLTTILTNLRSGNAYIRLIDGVESYETHIYNSIGESVVQGNKLNNITVFRNDDKSVMFAGDTVTFGRDIDILRIMENSVKTALENDIIVRRMIKPISGFRTYNIYIDGWDNIRLLYKNIGDDFADGIIENMKETVNEGDEVILRFKYTIGSNAELSGGCEIIINGEHFAMWYFDGYLLLYDWKLPDEWYSSDFTDGTKAEEMLGGLLTQLDKMLQEFAISNDLNLE